MIAIMRAAVGVLVAGLCSGCRAVDDGKGAEPGCCDDCCVENSTTFPTYEYSFGRDPGDNLSNWASHSSRSIAIEPDLPSFDGVMKEPGTNNPYSLAAVSVALTTFADYWNAAGADISVSVGTTGINCCNSLTDADPGCVDCLADPESSIYVWEGDSYELFPDDAAAITSATASGSCLVAKDILLFTGFYKDDGTWCEYNWQYPWGDEDQGDAECSDGEKTKLFKDALVHEFGHFVGLGHQSLADFPSSAMLGEGDTCPCPGGVCACSFDTIQDPDKMALVELYQQCQ
jgi:hypothetical protein